MPSFDYDINQTMLPTGVGCHALCQGIFLTQGSSLHLLMSAALAGKFCATSVPPGKPSLLSCSHYHSPTLLPHDLNTLRDNPAKTLISKIFDLLSSKHLSFVLAHLLHIPLQHTQVAQLVRNPSAMQETPVRFLGQEEPLEKG